MNAEREEFLNDILITALEGGIGYWAEIKNYKCSKTQQASAQVREQHDDFDRTRAGRWVHVNKFTIRLGIDRILTGKSKCNQRVREAVYQASLTNDAGDIDIDLADVIFQEGFLGDLVYG